MLTSVINLRQNPHPEMTQAPHIKELLHEPLSAKMSQGSPMWRLRISGERMVFCGRTFGMHIAGGLLLAPVIYWTCGQWGADRGLQFGLTLFPIFYAGGMAVGCLVTMAIPRIEYDLSRQRVLLPLGRELSLSEILAVQVIEYLRKWGDDDELFAYQLNLCYLDRHTPQRISLVECCADVPLIRDAQLMANTLGVPLHEHYLTPEAILAWESREAKAHSKLASWLLVPGIMATILFAAYGLVIARQPKWPRWNDPLWIGLLIPSLLLVAAICFRFQMKRDQDRRLSRAERSRDSV